MDDLYKTYGMKMVQLEILQNEINDIKRQIATAMNGEKKDEESQEG